MLNPLYKPLDIMKFLDLNKYLSARFLFRYVTARVPDGLHSYFRETINIIIHETRTAGHYHIPAVVSDLGKTDIRFRGAVMWNDVLSNDINMMYLRQYM